MPFPLIPVIALGAAAWLIGKGSKETVDSATKAVVVAGVVYIVVKKLS